MTSTAPRVIAYAGPRWPRGWAAAHWTRFVRQRRASLGLSPTSCFRISSRPLGILVATTDFRLRFCAARAGSVRRTCSEREISLVKSTLHADPVRCPLHRWDARVCSTSVLAPVCTPLAALTRVQPPRKRYFVDMERPVQSCLDARSLFFFACAFSFEHLNRTSQESRWAKRRLIMLIFEGRASSPHAHDPSGASSH